MKGSSRTSLVAKTLERQVVFQNVVFRECFSTLGPGIYKRYYKEDGFFFTVKCLYRNQKEFGNGGTCVGASSWRLSYLWESSRVKLLRMASKFQIDMDIINKQWCFHTSAMVTQIAK